MYVSFSATIGPALGVSISARITANVVSLQSPAILFSPWLEASRCVILLPTEFRLEVQLSHSTSVNAFASAQVGASFVRCVTNHHRISLSNWLNVKFQNVLICYEEEYMIRFLCDFSILVFTCSLLISSITYNEYDSTITELFLLNMVFCYTFLPILWFL